MNISEWKKYQQDGKQELEAATKEFLFELGVYKLGLQHYKNGVISKTQRKQYRKNFCKKWKIKACAEAKQEYIDTELVYACADRRRAFIEAAQQKEKLLNAEAEPKIKIRHILLIATILIFTWQYSDYAKSFDSCQNTLQEVKINLANLGQSISELEILINNQHRWEKAHD